MTGERAVIVIGGHPKFDDVTQCWRTSKFNEPGRSDSPGDRLRIDAAAVLAYDCPEWVFIPTGGKGQLQGVLPAALSIADIMTGELVYTGVSRDRILKEDNSGNTWSQLLRTQQIIEAWQLDQPVSILSNGWQLPRIVAMLERAPRLDYFRELQVKGQLGVMSAENVLVKYDTEDWKIVVVAAYLSDNVRACIVREAEGVQQIMEGTYNFVLRS